jgi:outer membrane receptor protein involved in Fe transport
MRIFHILVATLLFIVFFLPQESRAQNSRKLLVVAGQVVDKHKKPIEFATVRIEEPSNITYTDTAGKFSFSFYQSQPSAIKLIISFVGKKEIERTVVPALLSQPLSFQMSDFSLTLDEVQVTGVRRGENSNSSLLFNREAIEQTQAFSLADILNNLPGKTTIAPNLQSPQQITLRSEAGGAHALNNALGTAIIMDGVRVSNDANMQNTNVGKNGMAGSIISGKYGTSDVAFGGIDLREIPADNIESVEVVSGVASAQYGELTDGAVIINRQAGKTDYQLNTRVNGASINLALSKGFALSKKAGALNVSLNYLNSNNDPSDNLKSYSRISMELMWTNFIAKGIKHTLSVGYNTRLDNTKADPDEGAERSMFAKSRNLRVSERVSMQFNKKWINSVRLSFSYSRGYQETYSQWWLNGPVRPIADKDTTGIYEGYYIPGTYYAIEHIKGIPVNMSANLGFTSNLNTGSILHAISWGASFSQAANYGEGTIADPYRPRWPNSGSKNDRPYSYKTIPDLPSYGFFLEDHFKVPFLGRNLYMNAGARYDLQNGWGSIQPRINARYKLNNQWELNMAYGISTKTPTMAHRYPGPTFYDVLLLNEYTGDARTSLVLVYTEKYIPDNSKLKPSVSNQLEGGIRFNGSFISSSLFAYYKNNKNGFTGVGNYRPFILPVYKSVSAGPGQKPSYYATGETQLKASLFETHIENSLSSKNYGAEWFISTKKIRTIQTSFDLNTSFTYSDFINNAPAIIPAGESYIALKKKAWYGIYPPLRNKNLAAMSKINSVTHISKLGFVVNLSADIFWLQRLIAVGRYQYPYAYLDQNLTYYAIKNFDPANTDYGHLVLSTEKDSEANIPFVYANLSIRVSKEIKKSIRFSVNAYNVLNIQPKYSNATSTVTYNNPLSVGAEFSIKF